MADTGIFASAEEVSRKANVNSSSTSNSVEYIDQYMTEVESLINSTVTFNFSDEYSNLNVDTKGILKLAATEWAAWQVEKYDIDAIGRATANLSANMHLTIYDRCLTELKSKNTQDFIKGA